MKIPPTQPFVPITFDYDDETDPGPYPISADAASLPVYPGLVRYDEVAAGVVDHAIRITVPRNPAQLRLAGTGERWDNDALRTLNQIRGSDFEVVDASSLIVHPDSGQVASR